MLGLAPASGEGDAVGATARARPARAIQPPNAFGDDDDDGEKEGGLQLAVPSHRRMHGGLASSLISPDFRRSSQRLGQGRAASS